VLSLSKRLAENQGRILMKILDKDEAWTIYNEFFKDDDFVILVLKVNELKWEDASWRLRNFAAAVAVNGAADSAIDASYEASKYLNEFNNLYRLLMDIALECEPWISSDDEIERKASYFSQMAGMYDDISPEELRLSYAEGKCYEESSNRFVELTVEQTKFIVLMGSIIIENCWLELRSHNEGKEEL
jgi:hypothetical protein